MNNKELQNIFESHTAVIQTLRWIQLKEFHLNMPSHTRRITINVGNNDSSPISVSSAYSFWVTEKGSFFPSEESQNLKMLELSKRWANV